MKSKLFGIAAGVFIGLVAVCSSYGQCSGEHSFSGMIGDEKVEIELTCIVDDITGNYYYRRSGSANRLKLKGTIAGDGSFTMQETTAAGKQTGTFKGKWKNDDNSPGAWLEGEWLKPGQTDEGLDLYAFEQLISFTKTRVTPRETKEAMKLKKATLTAAYPELSVNVNAALFNALAKAEVTKALAAFRKDMNSLTAADIRSMPSDMGNYIEVDYIIEFADEDLISVNFTESTFTGGAHPNSGTTTLTYDLKAGRKVLLADLFKPGSRYLAKIADYAKNDLQSRKDPETGENMGIAQDIWEDGVKPTAANYSNWNVTRKGLLITFPAYQVAAYAYGPQTVIVPYSHLMGIARPDGALRKSAK